MAIFAKLIGIKINCPKEDNLMRVINWLKAEVSKSEYSNHSQPNKFSNGFKDGFFNVMSVPSLPFGGYYRTWIRVTPCIIASPITIPCGIIGGVGNGVRKQIKGSQLRSNASDERNH